ncbi:hypothetical protein MMC19_003353 [Ptychographa xylographoides]|nr:hypothetical protein [Ptychographa xylographoides]
MESSSSAEALIPAFELSKVLNQGPLLTPNNMHTTRSELLLDQAGRRITLLGLISSKPALLTIERAALPTDPTILRAFHDSLTNVSNLGANDIYAWYLANVRPTADAPDLKLNLIYPCTEAHIKKYSPQITRVVTETPETYTRYVRPYMQRKREEGRLNWVFNIIEGRTEQEDIILRSSQHLGHDPEGFLLLPDMNWDRKTLSNLRILGLVERRDLWSLRDLKKADIAWLKSMLEKILVAVEDIYDGVERDLLKVYLHYQPTYYHFHIHITTTSHEPSATQATLKAFSLPNLIAQLETMAGGPEASLADTSITYTIGEASELWTEVFGPLKAGKDVAGHPTASALPSVGASE